MWKCSVFPANGGFKSTVIVSSLISLTVAGNTWSTPGICIPRTIPTSGFKSPSCSFGTFCISSGLGCPYASSGFSVMSFSSPSLIPITACSNPLITCPSPTLNVNGSFPSELSNTSPLSNVPL